MSDDEETRNRKLPSGYASPLWNYGSSIQTITNPNEFLWELELYFRNMREKDGKLIQLGEPRLTEQGINDVFGIIKSAVNQMSYFSDLEDHHIEGILFLASDALTEALMVHGRTKYGCPSLVDRDLVNQQVICSLLPSLRRAYLGGERTFWKGSLQEIKSTVHSETAKPSGLAKFNPFKKG